MRKQKPISAQSQPRRSTAQAEPLPWGKRPPGAFVFSLPCEASLSAAAPAPPSTCKWTVDRRKTLAGFLGLSHEKAAEGRRTPRRIADPFATLIRARRERDGPESKHCEQVINTPPKLGAHGRGEGHVPREEPARWLTPFTVFTTTTR